MVRSQQTKYDLADLVIACKDLKNRRKNVLFGDIKEDARRIFGLETGEEIRDFIAYECFINYDFINTKPLEKHSFNVEVMVDAYSFLYDKVERYIAIFRKPDGSWVIKSLKNRTTQLTQKPFSILADAMKDKMGLDEYEEKIKILGSRK